MALTRITGTVGDSNTHITGSAVSSSATSISKVFSGGVMSGSAQTAANLPSGVISGSGNLSASLPPGTMSGSAQTAINLPTGTVSASMGISGSAKSTASFAQILVGGSDGSNVFAVISGSGASGVVRISGSIQSTGSFGALKTGDLELENKRGHWKIVEESEYLSITNVNTNKKYKILMEEIE